MVRKKYDGIFENYRKNYFTELDRRYIAIINAMCEIDV